MHYKHILTDTGFIITEQGEAAQLDTEQKQIWLKKLTELLMKCL